MRRALGGMLIFMAGCSSLFCIEREYHSPSGPPAAVERWWDEYLADARPEFVALLVEGSEALRREEKTGLWGHNFVGYSSGPNPSVKCSTLLALPMPEACIARGRARFVGLTAEQLVPKYGDVKGFSSDEDTEKIWLETARKLGYRDRKD